MPDSCEVNKNDGKGTYGAQLLEGDKPCKRASGGKNQNIRYMPICEDQKETRVRERNASD